METQPGVRLPRRSNALRLVAILAVASAGGSLTSAADKDDRVVMKTARFDRDPGFEGHQNRVVLKSVPIVAQDFGYSPTQFAGAAVGEIGGRITRTTRPAYYASKIAPKTLGDKLSASGAFAITASQPGAGLFFGWFNAQQPGGSGRPIGSLGLHMDFEGSGGRLAVRLITGSNQSCGTFITPYLPGKYRTTPLKNDGTRYRWTLDYDPAGAAGNGRFSFTLRSDNHPVQAVDPNLPAASQKEERARFPTTTTFTVDLPPEFQTQGTTFDRFGMMNMMKAGGVAAVYFADVRYDEQTADLSQDPGWIGAGNRDRYEDREQVGAHNFGFSAETSFAGGEAGEIGGDLWRSGEYAYFADRIGPLTLGQPLEARGKVTLVVGGPDADMYLGWFSSAHRDQSPAEAGDFLGVAVGGPTRVGHYFAPSFTSGKGTRGKVDSAPLLKPGQCYDWSLVYRPDANDGLGEITVTLGEMSAVLPLKPGQKLENASFDRFGLFTSQAGGQLVRIYVDDLTYTAAIRPSREGTK